jgi:uncharacterized phage protein gp47/JayE
MATNVPAPTLTDTGFAAPADADVLTGLFADLNAAFGGNLNPSLSTPQGQLATALALILANANGAFLAMANNVDPAFASGRFQDAIGRLYFIERNEAVATTVAATVVGSAGTFIPAGSLAQAADGSIYETTGDVTIGAGGSSPATFANTETGPIACAAGTLTKIYRSVNGWDQVYNTLDGVPGRDVETRIDFEARRAASVALNSVGLLPSMRAAILSVDNVLDAYVTENSSASAITIGSVTLAPNSIYAAVEGGTDADVARAIWTKKAPGCSYNGNTTVTVEDQSSGYTPPYPAYNVTFQRPTALPVYFAVSIASSSAVPSNAQTLVRNAILAAFNGEDGGQRVHIGATVYATRFIAGVAQLGTWAQVVSLHIGTTSSPTADSVGVGIDQFPSTAAANITLTVV